MKSRILVCVCGADGEKPRYYRVFTGTILQLSPQVPRTVSQDTEQSCNSSDGRDILENDGLPDWVGTTAELSLQTE